MSSPIPSPPKVPFLGTVGSIEKEVPLRSFTLLANQFGEIYQLSFLGRQVIVVTNHKLINELCDETRFYKGVSGSLEEVRNATKDGLFTAYHNEPNWAIAHRILLPAFGPAAIRDMFDDMYDICSQLLLKWERFGSDYSIDLVEDFTRLTLDTISLCSMSYRFNSFYQPEPQPFVVAMTSFLAECFARSTRPSVVQALMTSATAQYAADQKIINDVCEAVIAKRRAQPSSQKKDLLNMMLNGRDPVTGQGLSDENIKGQLITFLIAGHETSSGLASFAVYYLLKNPHAYQRLRAEVDAVLGTTPIRKEHLSKLPYTNAVLRETLRLQPPAPSIILRSYEDTTIGGGKYEIRKGVSILVMSNTLHRDPAVWGNDADEFKPERMMPGEFEKLPKNAWKPFGNGVRACIGRGFALQEVVMLIASIFQKFDLRLEDPSYNLELKQALTIKPRGMRINAIPRANLSVPRGVPSPTAPTLPGTDPVTTLASSGAKPLYALYGGNTGSCEGFAQKLAESAGTRGFSPKVATLDSVAGQIPTDGPVFVITASFEGLPADNAGHFVEYLKNINNAPPLSAVRYAVFGCGNKEWAATYQAVPRLCDQLMERGGAKRLLDRVETDAGGDTFFETYDDWEAKLWPILAEVYHVSGDGKEEEDDFIVHVTDTVRAARLRQSDAGLGTVVENRILTRSGAPEKLHIEFELPENQTYRAGDYLAILPTNPPESVRRCLARFGLLPEHQVTVKTGGSTTLPVDTPISVSELLSGYVELSQPATKKNIHALLEVTSHKGVREKLEVLSASYKEEIFEKRLSVLDILEQNKEISLHFGSFLRMLPAMRIRQYSISSSPLWNPQRVTLTVSIVDAPTLSGHGEKFLGVASNYLASLKPGDRTQIAVRGSSTTFRLPGEAETPIVMMCAGAGIAPMRGFIQERAAQLAAGRKVGRALLFVGCRSPDDDFLYSKDELAVWAKMGAVDIRPAFSREPGKSGGCKYVQHRVWHDRADIDLAYNAGAKFYTCGSLAVAQGIKDTIVKMIMAVKQVDDEEALRGFQKIQTERYATDVFG